MQGTIYSSLNLEFKNIYCLADATHANEMINLQIIQVYSLFLNYDYMAESLMLNILKCQYASMFFQSVTER